jgi:hypothetical protein
MILLFSSRSGPSGSNQNKSFILFLIIVMLHLVKDRHEKKGQSSETQDVNNLGRGVFLLIVYVCFSVLSIYKLSALQMFLHLLFISSYAYFFLEDFK